MTQSVDLYLPPPTAQSNGTSVTGGNVGSRELFDKWAYSTQIMQADYTAQQLLYYRQGAARPENNFGAIFWQGNDVWPGASWSSKEFGGRWKVR